MPCPHLGAGSVAGPAPAIPVCPRGAEEVAVPRLGCPLWGWQGAGHSGAAAGTNRAGQVELTQVKIPGQTPQSSSTWGR